MGPSTNSEKSNTHSYSIRPGREESVRCVSMNVHMQETHLQREEQIRVRVLRDFHYFSGWFHEFVRLQIVHG